MAFHEDPGACPRCSHLAPRRSSARRPVAGHWAASGRPTRSEMRAARASARVFMKGHSPNGGLYHVYNLSPMATLRAFRALRPRPADAARVAAVPYDVVSTEEARVL